MAILVNAATDQIQRTTSLPDDQSFTACGWAYVVSNAGDTTVQPLFFLGSGDGTQSFLLVWEDDSPGSATELWVFDGGVVTDFAAIGSQHSAGTWFHWFVRCGGGGADACEAGTKAFTDASYATGAVTPSVITPGLMAIGAVLGAYGTNGRHAAIKCWDSVLTNDELLNESQYYTAVRRTSLRYEWPLLDSSDARDLSGNNLVPTLTSVDTADGPPIRWAPGFGVSQFSAGAAARRFILVRPA